MSTSTLWISLAFLIFGSVGIAIQSSDRCSSDDNAAATPAAGLASLAIAQRSVVDYINGTTKCADSHATQSRETARRFQAALKKGEFARAREDATQARQMSERFATCLDSIVPADDPALATQAERSAQSVRLIAAAWTDYERGSRGPTISLLTRGDRRLIAARRRSKRAAAAVDRIYQARGGADELGDYIDFERLLAVRKRSGVG